MELFHFSLLSLEKDHEQQGICKKLLMPGLYNKHCFMSTKSNSGPLLCSLGMDKSPPLHACKGLLPVRQAATGQSRLLKMLDNLTP
jgi:hypothetical protein